MEIYTFISETQKTLVNKELKWKQTRTMCPKYQFQNFDKRVLTSPVKVQKSFNVSGVCMYIYFFFIKFHIYSYFGSMPTYSIADQMYLSSDLG